MKGLPLPSLLGLCFLAGTTVAFGVTSVGPGRNELRQRSSLLSSATAEPRSVSSLEDISAFEEWFNNTPGAKCDSRLTHSVFGGLRGLAWRPGSTREDATGSVVTLPRTVVLSSSLSNWDADLACLLWKEVLKGSSSSMSGYVRLLTAASPLRSSEAVPPSTAPNALRHWTAAQREALSSIPLGEKLLALDKRQQEDWKAKYAGLAAVDRPASWAQFDWSMEVVHSRAFRGLLDGSLASSLPGLLAPIAAAALGYAYFMSTGVPDERVFAGLAVAALLPAVRNLVAGGQTSSVVLLPLIDSANHLESVNSAIAYNPLSGAFELSISPDCVVAEPDGQQQVYISYGKKGDTELLLNYGFLPGIAACQDDAADEAARTQQRQQLAQGFVARNS